MDANEDAFGRYFFTTFVATVGIGEADAKVYTGDLHLLVDARAAERRCLLQGTLTPGS